MDEATHKVRMLQFAARILEAIDGVEASKELLEIADEIRSGKLPLCSTNKT